MITTVSPRLRMQPIHKIPHICIFQKQHSRTSGVRCRIAGRGVFVLCPNILEGGKGPEGDTVSGHGPPTTQFVTIHGCEPIHTYAISKSAPFSEDLFILITAPDAPSVAWRGVS